MTSTALSYEVGGWHPLVLFSYDFYSSHVELDRRIVPLCVAVAQSNTLVFAVGLLSFGAAVNIKDCDGYAPIVLAAMRQDVEMVMELSDWDCNLDVTCRWDLQDEDVWSPLAAAVENCNLELVELLLSLDADPNLNQGCLPLVVGTP